uniref:Uncharacterized protein n=1 Tax=Anguilla anguilla TaxID=7936 RepID=A0A0E9PKM9_ANGAN
MQVRSNLPKIA